MCMPACRFGLLANSASTLLEISVLVFLCQRSIGGVAIRRSTVFGTLWATFYFTAFRECQAAMPCWACVMPAPEVAWSLILVWLRGCMQ